MINESGRGSSLQEGSGGAQTRAMDSDRDVSAGDVIGNQEAGEDVNSESSGASNNEAQCTDGAPTGLCEVCEDGRSGALANAESRCPPIDCASYQTYSQDRNSENQTECIRSDYMRGPTICKEPGLCFSEPREYCQFQASFLEISAEDVGECRRIEGCRDQEAPRLSPKAGEPCQNGRGSCDDQGECVIACGDLSIAHACTERSVSGYCDFLVTLSLGGGILPDHCTEFCESIGGVCEEAWRSLDCPTSPRDARRCDDRQGSRVCRCGSL